MKKFELGLILFSLIIFTGCNGGLNLTVGKNGAEGAPITVDPGSDPTPAPSATPEPSPTPSPTPNPTPEPTPTPAPIQGLKSQIFVSKALANVSKPNSRVVFEQICQKEAKKANLSGKFTALVGLTDVKFTDQYQVPGTIYQKVGNEEIVVADSFQGLINGHNNAIYAAACGKRIDQSLFNLVWTGNLNFNEASRPDFNCNNWGTKKGKAIVGWMGATGEQALSLRYLNCGYYARVYCIEVQ
jgi:hypothetical protein